MTLQKHEYLDRGRIEWGDKDKPLLRLERRHRPEHENVVVLNSATRTARVDVHSGEQVTQETIRMDDKGNPVYHWVLYRRTLIKDGKHPIHKDRHGDPEDTTFDYIWLPEGDGPVKEMVEKADAIAADLKQELVAE